MNAITVREAEQHLDQLIESVVADVEPTIIMNDDGKKAVLFSLDEFNAWQETFYLLSNPANAEHLQKSIEEARAGKITEHQLIES
ncbi:MAG: antitoxin [bacterium]|nr:antitoxin [bacterium]